MIDLHTHTTASDGTLTPQELVDLAAAKGVRALALTDHDTVAGIATALECGKERRVEVIPGIELAAKWNGVGQMHILGYHIDRDNTRFTDRLSWLQARRRERGERIVSRLNELGVPISWERVEQLAGTGSVGRPHVARVLLESGQVETISEAFSRYLSPGAPAYLEKVEMAPAEAIELIRTAGGVAVLAHPSTLKLTGSKLEACVEHLATLGLAGIEVYWPKHTEVEKASYKRLGDHYNLVATMGSDFHGSSKPAIELGMGFTEAIDVDRVLRALRSRAGTNRGGHKIVGWTADGGQPRSGLEKQQVAGD